MVLFHSFLRQRPFVHRYIQPTLPTCVPKCVSACEKVGKGGMLEWLSVIKMNEPALKVPMLLVCVNLSNFLCFCVLLYL